MFYLNFYFLAAISIILFISGIIARRYSLLLASIVANFSTAYSCYGIELPYVFLDNGSIIEHIKVITEPALSFFFMLLGVFSLMLVILLSFYPEKA